MQDLLLAQYRRVAGSYRDAQLALARKNVVTRLDGDAGSGLANGLVYVALGLLLAAAWLPLAVAGPRRPYEPGAALSELIHAVHNCYEQGLYLTDHTTFLATARGHLPPPAHRRGPAGPVADHGRGRVLHLPRRGPSRVSLTIDAGQVVALVGENGSGTSTLAHLYTPDAGHI